MYFSFTFRQNAQLETFSVSVRVHAQSSRSIPVRQHFRTLDSALFPQCQKLPPSRHRRCCFELFRASSCFGRSSCHPLCLRFTVLQSGIVTFLIRKIGGSKRPRDACILYPHRASLFVARPIIGGRAALLEMLHIVLCLPGLSNVTVFQDDSVVRDRISCCRHYCAKVSRPLLVTVVSDFRRYVCPSQAFLFFNVAHVHFTVKLDSVFFVTLSSVCACTFEEPRYSGFFSLLLPPHGS